jgi:glutaconate CoA-transferase subunit A
MIRGQEVRGVPKRKLMSLEDAVARFVQDGDTVYAGYLVVPFALTHEIARQGKRNLEVVGASNVWPCTELVVAGCCRRVRTGYVAGALRPGYIQDLMARGELEYEDYSNQGIALMLMAGALGIPFVPTRSFLGSDYLDPKLDDHPGRIPGYKRLHVMDSPFDGQKAVLLPALKPDVVIMHAQRADEEGNIQAWGHLGDARWGMWAGKRVIVTVEEIVSSEEVRSDPSRTILPGFRVSAVVHCPFGAHPSGVAGYYDFDYAFLGAVIAPALAAPEAFRDFLAAWVESDPARKEYVAKVRSVIGDEAFEKILPSEPLTPHLPVDYGYSRTLNVPRRAEP